MLLIEDIKLLPIIIKLTTDFQKAKMNMKILGTERLDDKRVVVVIEIELPEKVLH
jgi:hypothetical protein